MRFFDGFLLNTILLLFPLFIYIIYVAYQKMTSRDTLNQTFEVSLFLSLFLISRYGCFKDNSYVSILMNIPLLFAYLNGSKISTIMISIILSIYSIIVLKYNAIIVIFEYCAYFILYILSSHKNITSNYIINSFVIIKSFMLSLFTFYFIAPTTSVWSNLFNIILSISIFYLVAIFY